MVKTVEQIAGDLYAVVGESVDEVLFADIVDRVHARQDEAAAKWLAA